MKPTKNRMPGVALLILIMSFTSCNSEPTSTSQNKSKSTNESSDTEVSELAGKDRWGERTGTFHATNLFTLDVPEGARVVNAWFAMPQQHNADQTVADLKVECEHELNVVKDQFGDEFLKLELKNPTAGVVEIKTSFTVTRHEIQMPTDSKLTRQHTANELAEMKAFLVEQQQGAVTPEIRKMAQNLVGQESNPLIVARKLYDGVLDHVDYWVKDPENLKSSGSGNAQYCLTECTGNCTDFHSLYQAMCTVVQLPCRTVYGSLFKTPLDGKDSDQSYHCWLEIHAPNVGWIPLDVAVADIFVKGVEVTDDNREKIRLTVADDYAGPSEELVDYYFGNLDARRVVWHEGRDLQLEGATETINYLPTFYVEVNEAPASIATRKLTFTEVK